MTTTPEHTEGQPVTTCDECGTEIPEDAGAVLVPVINNDGEVTGQAWLCAECASTPAASTLAGESDTEPADGGDVQMQSAPVPLAADAPPGDTYGREQAARVLGVSPRRVSQLADDGRLEVVQPKPLRLSAESVHRLREERRSPNRDQKATVPPDPAGDTAAQIERVLALFQIEHRKAIEAGEHLLAEVSAQRDEYRSEVERLRAEVEAERTARQAAEHARRRWWQKG